MTSQDTQKAEIAANSGAPVLSGRSPSLKCDMCGKPLKSRRFQISVFMRPDKTMTVGPDCFRKERKAVAAMKERFTEAELEAKRATIAAALAGEK